MINQKILIFISILFIKIIASDDSSFTTIIIGAGSAGIAAATRLFQNNITDILILEAENRIGGRINSIPYENVFVDLGAEWCYGKENNIIYEMVKDFDLLAETLWNLKLQHSAIEPIDEDVETDIFKTILLLTGDLNHLNGGKPKNYTVGDLFYETYNKTVLKKYQNDPKKIKIALDGIDFIKNCVSGFEAALNWNDLSVHSPYKECPQNEFFNWKGNGYKTIIEILLQKYPNPKKALKINDKILLNKEVTKISWGDENDKEIVIHCSDDTKYRSKSIIFTPSLGVLKAQHKTLFSPNLPREKIQAIETIGFGSAVKVVLNFTERWWKDDTSSFMLFWTKEDKEKLIKDDKLWLSHLTDIYSPNIHSNILIIWFYAEPQIEQLLDEIILNGCEFALRQFLGRTHNITKPNLVARTSWYNNPHFRGTWSYETPKAAVIGKNLHQILSVPIQSDHNKKILFAGEVTHPKYFSTVHGAIETGFREADRIIASNKN